jgi:hypothetical protein
MRDGAAERGPRRSLRINVNELMIFSRVGKFLDPILVDHQPRRDPDLASDAGADLVEAGNWHEQLFAGM